MSIIHDALKKAQQNQADKTSPAPATPPLTSNDIFSSQGKLEKKDDELPIEYLPPTHKKARPVLVLLCAIVFFLGSLTFCYKQLHKNFPQIDTLAKSLFYKLIHKKEEPDFKTRKPEDLVPLAKITVNPQPPKPISSPLPQPISSPLPLTAPKTTKLSSPANLPLTTTPTGSDTIKPYVSQTLDIHGVMSNGTSNVVLINDQVYQEGDDIDGVKIVKINLDSIKVINNGKEETIRVKD